MHALVALCAAILGGLNQCVASLDPSPDVVSLTGSTTRFSHKLYKDLTSDLPVAVYSPFSAHTALSMVYLGARTTTADEMKSVLQLSGLPRPHETYKGLLRSLDNIKDAVVYTANGIWINKKIGVREEYIKDVVQYYNAAVEEINFSAPGGPHVPINQWVADRTENKIKDLLGRDFINPLTTAVLVNSLYFNATWLSQFKLKSTQGYSFQTKERVLKEVDFMSQEGDFGLKLSAIENVDVLRLPFKNNRFAFYIVLPRTVEDFTSLETMLSGDNFDDSIFFNGLRDSYVHVKMPKFKITATLNMVKHLRNLGMAKAFSENADFSGISDKPLRIDNVVQKAVIEVTETGTVAAAATAVGVMRITSVDIRKPIKFFAERPFLFYIRDDDTQLILFQGKQTDPTKIEVKNEK